MFCDLLQGTIQSNALFSSLQTNYKQVLQNGTVFSLSQNYSGCDCASSATCVFQSAIYNYPNLTSLFNVPGFYTGCYVIESLLQSNLQCFFNQTCINTLQTYFPSSMSMQITHYWQVYILEIQLFNNLLIEQWNSSIMYGNYYNECHPIQCTYNIQARNDVTHIVTMLIGGMIAILNLIVPRLVKFIVQAVRKREMRVISEMEIIQT